jgi:hypothetical protein
MPTFTRIGWLASNGGRRRTMGGNIRVLLVGCVAAIVPAWRVLATALVTLAAQPTLTSPRAPIEVTFDGSSLLGLPLLTCASQPDRPLISVEAGTPIDLLNHTGHTAAVRLNGESRFQVADGSSAAIHLGPGSWQATLVPDCLLNLNAAGTLDITVTKAPTPSPSLPTTTPSTAAPPPTTNPTARRTTTAPKPSSPLAAPTHPHTRASTAGPSWAWAWASESIDQAPHRSADPPTYASQIATSTANNAPNYLLTLVAIFGIIGVGCAAIRALSTRRASRRISGSGRRFQTGPGG